MPLGSPDALKRLDRRASGPARAAGRALALAASRRRPADEVLVVRPGGMGDLICAQIAAEDLGLDPRGITWLIERRSQAWARYAGLRHVAYDEQPARVLARVAGRHRQVVNTEQRFGLSQALALAARARGGRLTCFATMRGAASADRVVPYDPYDGHERDAFRTLLAGALDREDTGPRPDPRPRRTPASGELLAVVSGRQSPTRALSLERWRDLVAGWARGRPVTIAAAPVDRAFAAELRAALPGPTESLEGGFDALCARIAAAEELFTMDGGPVHIASYLGVPTTAIFTSGRERKWGPLAPGSALIRRTGLACQPCTLFGQTPPCPHGLACHALAFPRDRLEIDQLDERSRDVVLRPSSSGTIRTSPPQAAASTPPTTSSGA